MITVLLIDRDKTRLAAAAAVLARCGYCPLSARSDDEALGLLSQFAVQVVLAPVTAGACDGALIATIQRRFPDLPVVALRTAYTPANLINAVGLCLQRALAA
jgi:CheY-like chemotaxis protein